MEVLSCDGTKSDNFLAGFRILLVDDDEISLKVIEKVLTSCQYEVVTTNRATNALNIIHERNGGFNLIMADVHMPIMDGFELLAIVQRDFQIPVILVSADSERDLMNRGLKFGACAFCVKPVTKNYAQNLWQFVCMQRIHQQRLVEEETRSSRQSSLKKKDVESSSTNLRSMEQKGIRVKDKGKKYEEVVEDDNKEVEYDAKSDEEIMTPKNSRMVWTPSLHQKFVCAIKKIGIKKAVPKKILEYMKVKGIDRTKIASHLQKYRNHLKGSKESSQYGRKIWDRYPASYKPGLSHFSDQVGSGDSSMSQEKYGHSYHTILNQRNIQCQLISTRLNTASVQTTENLSFRNLVHQQLQDPLNFTSVENSSFMNLSYQPNITNIPSVEESVISSSYETSSYKSNYVGLQLCDREGMIGLRQAGLGAGVNSYTLTSNIMNRTLPGKASVETLINFSNNNQVTQIAPTTDLYVNPGFFQTTTLVPVVEPQQPEGKQIEGMDLNCWSDLMMNNSTNDLSYHVPNGEYTQQEQDIEGLIMDPEFNVGELQFDDNYQPQM